MWGMDPLLDDLIGRFRLAQDAAVAFLIDVAKMSWPASNRDWARRHMYERPVVGALPNGAALYPHGHGIAVVAENLNVDFDWGDEGEPDGFDGWRLYVFSLDNCPQINCTHTQLNELLKSAVAQGFLIESGQLYYDPKRRASRQRPT